MGVAGGVVTGNMDWGSDGIMIRVNPLQSVRFLNPDGNFSGETGMVPSGSRAGPLPL